ncbi:winged helix-turn-helix domain-containing protein [Chloroflexi bacterium TSY]|nr:winged helix-turn-helix domain-containing protein [Chloroflexi bacterium TSY]
MNPPDQPTLQVLLYAESDVRLGVDIKRNLEEASFWVRYCRTLDEAMDWVFRHRQHPPDAVVIDIPTERSSHSMNAFKFYELLRRGGWIPGAQQRFAGWEDDVSILMLIDIDERLEIEERMYALSVQPDRIDYKPYRAHLLVSRLNGLLQRERPTAQQSTVNTALRIRSLTIDPDTEIVTIDSQPLKLSQLEFQLLYYLVSHPDTPLSRETLLGDIWGITGAKAVNNRNVDVYIGRLRKKLAGTDCADMIGRGRAGTYILQTNTWAENLTEPEGTSRRNRTISPSSSPASLSAKLMRTTNDTHLPNEVPIRHVEIKGQYKSGIKLGRNGGTVDYVLADKRVSRWHATIFVERNAFYIRDENSSGHTYITRINGDQQSDQRRLLPREHVQLENGDLIHFNTIAYKFVVDGS